MQKVKIKGFGFHAIGEYVITENPISPAALHGGTWERLPEGYALWTASSGAGETIAAGLPNITGSTQWVFYYDGSASDALSLGADGGGAPSGSGNKCRCRNLLFDASKSNSIYGKSATVQPPAYKAYVWKRVA